MTFQAAMEERVFKDCHTLSSQRGKPQGGGICAITGGATASHRSRLSGSKKRFTKHSEAMGSMMGGASGMGWMMGGMGLLGLLVVVLVILGIVALVKYLRSK